jgi:aryl-alcohol dehydrogenase-like predicted oxidoreductase
MQLRRIADVPVSAIGLGGMPMSIEGRPDEGRSVATIHAALDAGVTLIDTADAYHIGADEVGHNETLIARALASYGGDTSNVLIATKGGHLRPGDGSWTLNGSPEYLIRDLLDAGKIRLAGISNANTDQIRLANQILGGRLVSVQNQFSPAFRSSEPELALCAELGIAFLPWSPLGGITSAGDLGNRYAAFADVARAHGVSPQQVCLAWLLAKAPVVIPIPGSSRPETIRDSAAAPDLKLAAEQLHRLDTA